MSCSAFFLGKKVQERIVTFVLHVHVKSIQNRPTPVFELPGLGRLNPLPHLADPPTSGQNSTPGDRVSTPHLSFAEVGMLLDSHFLLMIMQFLKYLERDDLNFTTRPILIHMEG